MENYKLDKERRAKKRIEELKGFYIHFMVYCIINIFISTVQIVARMNDGETFMEVFWSFSTFSVWIFWGIGLLFHAIRVFSFNPFFGKDWEERQIRKFMEKDSEEAKKYSK